MNDLGKSPRMNEGNVKNGRGARQLLLQRSNRKIPLNH